MQLTNAVIMAALLSTILVLLVAAFSGPSVKKAQNRRLSGVRERHGGVKSAIDAQMRSIAATRPKYTGKQTSGLIPSPALLQHRLTMTGKTWTLKQYLLTCLGLAAGIAALLVLKGAPVLLGVLAGTAIGLLLPHFIVGKLIKRRVMKFTNKFPDAIDLMVRGLRSGLPISETLGIVSNEIEGPISDEFKNVTDKVRIGKTMDEALHETAERLGTPEFKFFTITLTIQRETGGNLAETLANLSDVLRKRAQMKLKIKAMSSEAKASAYIVGSLPFIVFGLVYTMNPSYLSGFFSDQRLILTGLGGMVWMSMGVAMMAKMINFEI